MMRYLIGTKVLVITGGEPFLHPDLSSVIALQRDRGMAVNITTNGLLLKRHWDWLKSLAYHRSHFH